MAVHTTNLFTQHPDDHRLSAREVQAMAHAATMVETTDQSKALARRTARW
jgi:metallo-beta-lactamase family protein